MTRRQNLAAAALSFAVAIGAGAAAAAVPAGAGGLDGMQPMIGDPIGSGERGHEAMHREMHELCRRTMAAGERGDGR